MMTLIDLVFPKLPPPKTWSDKCLKSPASDDPSTSNMVNVEKRSWNQHRSTFSIFIDHWQVNWVAKTLSSIHAKSWDCFLTHSLMMKSTLFLIETIERYQFRWNYLRKKTFPQFFTEFLKCILSFKYFEQKMTLIDSVFPILRTQKTWSDKCLKSLVLEDPSTSNMVNVPKHDICDTYQVNRASKRVSYWRAKSWDWLLIHWLPMKSFLFLIETIWRYQFRCNYVRKKTFPQFFPAFSKCILNFKYF